MLILYTKNNCVYCEKVKKAFEENGIEYEARNISENNEFLKEVQAHQARTMPFLVDAPNGIAMGESDDIITYALKQK